MDIITASNKESGLLNSLEASNLTDFYSYRNVVNAPNGSRNIWSVSPNVNNTGSNPHGKTITFRLPRYGLLQRALLKTDMVLSGATDDATADGRCNDTNIGLRLFSDISLKTKSKVICHQTPEYAHARVDNADVEESHTLSLLSQQSSTLGGSATTVSTYTPLFLPFSETQSNYLDLSFVDNLDLECVVNSASGMGLKRGLQSIETTLFLFYRNLENSVESAEQSQNFSPEKPLNMLIYDCYNEQVYPLTTGTTEATVNLNCKNVVFATHFYISRGASASSDGTNRGPSHPITSFDLSFTGKNVLSNIPVGVMRFDGSKFRITGDKVSNAGVISKKDDTVGKVSPVSLYWSEMKDRTFNSHSVAMGNINTPQLTIRCSATDETAYLHVIHETWKLCSISPDSGSIDVGLSV